MYNLDIDGYMSELELIQIEKWASEVPESGLIMEVGCLYGRSAFTWASSCHPSVKVFCVDFFYDINTDLDFQDIFDENTKNLANLVTIKTFSPYFQYSKYTDKMLDVFFLDAAHNNPFDWDNIKFALYKLKPGGILCGHDYHESWPDVVENVKRLEKLLAQQVTTYPNTMLWSFKV